MPNHCWQVQLMREWLFGTFRLFLFHQPVVAVMDFWVILYTNWLKKKRPLDFSGIFFFDRKDEDNRLTLVIDFKKEKQDQGNRCYR